MDVCEDDLKKSKENIDEVPRKKLKTSDAQDIFKEEKKECLMTKTEPFEIEDEQNLPNNSSYTSNEQFYQSELSTALPETPPSFEQDPIEQDTVWTNIWRPGVFDHTIKRLNSGCDN